MHDIDSSSDGSGRDLQLQRVVTIVMLKGFIVEAEGIDLLALMKAPSI